MIAIGVAMLTSCSEDDSVIVTEVNQTIVLLKQTINSNGLVTDYTYNGNKLISKSNNQGGSTTYTYTGDLLTRTDYSNSGGGNPYTGYTDLEYNTNNELIRYITYPSVTTLSVVRVEFTYNSNYITKDTYLGDVTSQPFHESQKEVFLTNGNITRINQNFDLQNNYEFDAKNAPLKNILVANVFHILGYSSGSNNLVKDTETNMLVSVSVHQMVEYIYNSNDYPETSTTVYQPGTANEWTETIQYIYD